MAIKTSKNDEKKPERKAQSEIEKFAGSYRSGWAYAEYAFQYAMSIVICCLIGYGLDIWLGTGNILMILGVVFGSVFGFLGLLKSLNVLTFGKGKSGKEK